MTKREDFVEAACKENVDDFLRQIQLHVSKRTLECPIYCKIEITLSPRKVIKMLQRRVSSSDSRDFYNATLKVPLQVRLTLHIEILFPYKIML